MMYNVCGICMTRNNLISYWATPVIIFTLPVNKSSMSVLRAPLYTEGVFSSVMGGNDGGDEGWIGKD